MFGLRAADEHRFLQAEQFTIGTDHLGKFVHFTGHSCKNWQGGLKHRRISAKDLSIYAKPELGERCVVSCFEEYLSLIPSKGPFYRRAVASKSGCPKFLLKSSGSTRLRRL